MATKMRAARAWARRARRESPANDDAHGVRQIAVFELISMFKGSNRSPLLNGGNIRRPVRGLQIVRQIRIPPAGVWSVLG